MKLFIITVFIGNFFRCDYKSKFQPPPLIVTMVGALWLGVAHPSCEET